MVEVHHIPARVLADHAILLECSRQTEIGYRPEHLLGRKVERQEGSGARWQPGLGQDHPINFGQIQGLHGALWKWAEFIEMKVDSGGQLRSGLHIAGNKVGRFHVPDSSYRNTSTSS